MIEPIFSVPSPIHGAPPKIVGLDLETGRFGLCKPLAVAPSKLIFVDEGEDLSGAVALASDVLRGDARAVTGPKTLMRLAVAFLAAAAKVGQLAAELEGLEVAAIEAAEGVAP